ncbi:MAG TPA: hypothetical protein VFQ72_01325 [Candidatus Paceibacterota bacterium]|nr:hypothetical protein [Candidatus Paceibacterota bacterium]
MYENNSTTNAILVILVVIVVGFIVWFVMARKAPAVETTSTNPALQVNLGGTTGGNGSGTSGQQ